MASVDIEIKAVIVRNDLNRAMLEIQRSMHRVAGITGRDFSREFARNLDLDPARHINARGFEREGARAGRNFSQGFNRAVDLRSPTVHVNIRRDSRSMVRDLSDVTRVATTTGGAIAEIGTEGASAAAKGIGALGGQVNDVLNGLGKVGVALKAVLGGLLVNHAIDLGKAVVTASQLLWAMPAAATAAAAGIGTLVIGMQGFGDAVKNIRDPEKFATALQNLAPSAQQAALSIQALLPQWDTLVRSTQQNLFAGVGQQLNALANQFMPALQSMTTSIAGSFNQMFMGITNTLSSNPQLITGTLDNIKQAFQNLAPAAAPFTKALAEIVNVGSKFLPQLATSVAEAATSFGEFITNAAKTGQLQQWITDGIDAAKELASTITGIGETIYDTFGSARPEEFKKTLEDVNTVVSGMATFITKVEQGWDFMARAARGACNTVIDALNAVLNPLGTVINLLNKLPGVNIDIGALGKGPFPHVGDQFYDGVAGTPTMAPGAPPGSPSVPGTPGASAGIGIGPALQTAYPAGGYAVPAPPPAKGANGGGPDVTVPYPSTDPNSLLQGYPATSSLYSSAQAVIKSQWDVAQQQAELDAVLKDNTATEAQIQKERNDVLKAQQDQHEAELRLNEAKAASTKKFTNATQEAVKGISDMGLDKDLGISRGIGGLVENLFKGLATALTAPLQDMLGNIVKANPGEGKGITGILAAQGLFGDQYRPENINAANAPQGGYGPGYGPTGTPGYGSNVDQAIGLAQSSNGKPYTWGGADLTKGLADCSGAVSSLTAVITGQPQGQRLFNTESFPGYAESHGWQRGYAPGQFNVGVKHGGPGGGHMAATLPNGMPFESGSNGITYGSGQGALNPSFTEQWHLPVGPSVTAPTYAPQTPLPTSMPGGGGPMAPGMPQGLPTPGYQPTQQQQQQPGWQPNGGGGGGGGLIGGAMSAATSAAGMFPGAGAAASIAQQAIQRTIQYASSSVGTLINGGLDALSISDPDSGSGASNLSNSWIGRLAGSLVSASPSLPSTAGKADQQGQQGQQQQGQQGQPQQSGAPTLHIENFNQSPDRQGVSATANDLALASARAGSMG